MTKTLLLVDGSSYLYRAFHALPDLRNRRNEPTGAIYGVLNMLRRLHKDYNADYSACIFDAKGKTFRDDLYPEYKSHRPPMPDDLACQIEPLHEAIRAMGWPLLMVAGVEADDVIGTLARLAEQKDVRTVVSTGDKDLAQLVNPHVTLVNTMSNEVLDEIGVEKKFGVPPNRILDYLALVGDTADNIPGVDKVGPKTAVKWLTQYGSLENLIRHADDIGGAVGDNLRKALDWLPTACTLLTVKTDVALPVTLEDLVTADADRAKLTELFGRFEFKTWLREIQEPGTEETDDPAPVDRQRHYATLFAEAELDAWINRLKQAPLISIDTETTSLDPMQARLVGISLSVVAGEGAYLPLYHRYAGAPTQLDGELALAKLRPLLEDASVPKLGQNIKYDMHVFANHGIRLRGVQHDTLLESYVLESHRPHDMDSMAMRHLGVKTITYAEVAGKGANQIGFDEVPVEAAAEYAAEDADITLQLHEYLYPQIAAEPRLQSVYETIEMPLMPVLFAIERQGVLIDARLLGVQSHELGTRMQALEAQAFEVAGQPFNLNSPKQIQEILFTRLGLPVLKKTPTGTPSTDEDVLQELALDYPLPKLLLEYRGLAKLKSTYTDKLPRMVNPATGRVHTNYAQAVAVTGRLSSSEPNLQNIPVRTPEGRRIREAFVAPPGSHIVSADYSQIELRIMAHVSGDPGLVKAFTEGLDVHSATAGEIFGVAPGEVTADQRRVAKVINFGLIYGMSAFGLASQLGLERSAAQAYIDRYFARYPGVAEYMQRTREEARTKGYVETVFGRRLWLPDIAGRNGPRRQAAERAAINAPMQGTAADLIKLAMVAVQNWLDAGGKASRQVMQVHDELVLEVPEAEVEEIREHLPRLMCSVARLNVPLVAEVGVGPNWEQAH